MARAQGSLEYLVIIAVAVSIVAVVSLVSVNYLGTNQVQYQYDACREAASQCKVSHYATPMEPCTNCESACKLSDGTEIFTGAIECCQCGLPEKITSDSAGCTNCKASLPECVEGATHSCTTGDNCAGTQACTNGHWTACTSSSRPCSTASNCPGTETCSGGIWGTCTDTAGDNCPPECTGSQTRACTASDHCPGTNACVNNRWSTTCVKDDPDCVCGAGDTKGCTAADGCAGTQSCVSGRWSATCTKNNPSCVCANGDTKACTTADGCAGKLTCANDVWGTTCVKDNPSCVCGNGATKACTDANGCAGTQTCSNNAWGTCVKNNPSCVCTSGQTRSCTTGSNCPGTQTCSASGTWGTCTDNAGDGCPQTCGDNIRYGTEECDGSSSPCTVQPASCGAAGTTTACKCQITPQATISTTSSRSSTTTSGPSCGVYKLMPKNDLYCDEMDLVTAYCPGTKCALNPNLPDTYEGPWKLCSDCTSGNDCTAFERACVKVAWYPLTGWWCDCCGPINYFNCYSCPSGYVEAEAAYGYVDDNTYVAGQCCPSSYSVVYPAFNKCCPSAYPTLSGNRAYCYK